MESEKKQCSICHKFIDHNFKLHEIQCSSFRNIRNESNSLNVIEEKEKEINPQVNNKTKENIIPENIKESENKVSQVDNDEISDLYFCDQCDNYCSQSEKVNHELAHQIENEENEMEIDENNDENLPNGNSSNNSNQENSDRIDIEPNAQPRISYYSQVPNNQMNNDDNDENVIQRSLNCFNGIIKESYVKANANRETTKVEKVTNTITGEVEEKTTKPNGDILINRYKVPPSYNSNMQNNSNMQFNQQTNFNGSNLFNPFARNNHFMSNYHQNQEQNFINANNQNNINNNNRFIPNQRQYNFPFDNHPSSRFLRGLENNSLNMQEFVDQLLEQHQPEEVDHSKLIDELSEFIYSEDNKIPSDKLNCLICMSDFIFKEEVIIMPCAHFFHKNCIKDWFKRKDTCPICLNKVGDQQEENSEES